MADLMTISEAQELKKAYENEIRTLLIDYEIRTGLTIQGVALDRVSASTLSDATRKSQIVGLHLKTLLP
jgi:hypothetical protein